MRILLFMSLFPVLSYAVCSSVWGLPCYETYSQTKPFTLKAGGSAAWDESIAIESGLSNPAQEVTMTVYPNPVVDAFRITVHGQRGPTKVIIYNISGQKILSMGFDSGNTVPVTTRLANGIYFAKLMMGGRAIMTNRFLAVR